MSKIFEGLQRAGADCAKPILECIPKTRAAAAPAVTREIEPDVPPVARLTSVGGVMLPGHAAAGPLSHSGWRDPTADPEDLAADAAAPREAHKAGRKVAARVAGPLSVITGNDDRVGEQYRIIRTKIVQHPAAPRRIVISSAGSGDGKTVTAGGLAWTLALRSGAKVLLVDADFRHSSIAGLYGIPGEPGLADILAGECAADDAIVGIEQVPNLFVLPCGKARSNPAELLDTARWRSLASDFGQRYRFTLFDAPPAGAVADYDLVQAACDGVVLVVRPDHSGRRACLKAIESTPRERLIGIVLNHVEDWFLWKSPNAYYYGTGKTR